MITGPVASQGPYPQEVRQVAKKRINVKLRVDEFKLMRLEFYN
jgi:hypothetical protein